MYAAYKEWEREEGKIGRWLCLLVHLHASSSWDSQPNTLFQNTDLLLFVTSFFMVIQMLSLPSFLFLLFYSLPPCTRAYQTYVGIHSASVPSWMGQPHTLALVSNIQNAPLIADSMLDFLNLSHENLKTVHTVRVQSWSFSSNHHNLVWDTERPEGVMLCWKGFNGSWCDTVWMQSLLHSKGWCTVCAKRKIPEVSPMNKFSVVKCWTRRW